MERYMYAQRLFPLLGEFVIQMSLFNAERHWHSTSQKSIHSSINTQDFQVHLSPSQLAFELTRKILLFLADTSHEESLNLPR